MRRKLTTIALFLLLLVPAAAQQTALTEGQIKAAELEVPELVKLLNLKPGMRVADVGAGFGAWTVRLAKVVGPSGHVYATDIGTAQLASLRDYTKREGLTNVTVLEGAAGSTNLPALCCDAMLIRDAYHHLTQPENIVASMAAALKPGGRLAVIDFPPRPKSEVPAGVAANRGGHGVPPEVVEREVGVALTHVQTIANWVPNSEPASLFLVLFQKPIAAVVQNQSPQPGGVTVFEGARLITGDGSAPIENSAFIVQSNRFTQVGRRGQLKVPAGATRVDLTGKTVMPAIVDAHTHMPNERPALVNLLQRKAYYGVAAVISMGQDAGDLALQVREEIIPNAARLRTAGRGITGPEPGRTEIPYWVTTEAEARKAAQELAARKVDIIKIWVDDRDGKYKKLTPALYGAVIDEAHKHNQRVTAHIVTLEDGKGLLRAGLDGFAHSVRDKDIDDEFVSMMKQRKSVFVIPNLPDRGVKTDLSWLSDTVSAEELKTLQDAAATDRPALQQAFGIQARNLARLNKEGVVIALGTDGGVPWSHHIEMADMVAAGMTPAQVIVAATRNAAQVLKLTDLGTVAAGKSADFIVLDANPLDDIGNTRRIASVYLRGSAVDRAAVKARWTERKP